MFDIASNNILDWGRLGIFIDEANLYHSQKTLGWKIGYKELKKYLSVGNIVHLRIYMATVEHGMAQQKLLNKLRELDFTIISKNLKRINSARQDFILKGNLDVELALDAHVLKDTFDTFVLFSGDSDFAYLVELLKQVQKRIVVISTGGHVSWELISKSDMYVDLKKIRENIEYIKSANPTDINPQGF